MAAVYIRPAPTTMTLGGMMAYVMRGEYRESRENE